MRKRRNGMAHIESPHKGSTDDWLTPKYIIDALGPFDLDPCAAPSPRPFPTAREHIELPCNGLYSSWRGRVWLNPPYGPEVKRWMTKMATHGRGTALIFARVETSAWFDAIWPEATAIRFLQGRVAFLLPGGQEAKWTGGAPSALVAYGDDDARVLQDCGLKGVYLDLRCQPELLKMRRPHAQTLAF